MKISPLLLFFALIFAFTVSAQTNQSASCPAFDITGDEKIVQSGERQTFTLNIK